jgi:hypothetical protein
MKIVLLLEDSYDTLYHPQFVLWVVISGHFVHKTLISMVLVGGDERGIIQFILE